MALKGTLTCPHYQIRVNFQKTESLLWFHSLATKLTLTCELQALFEGLVPPGT